MLVLVPLVLVSRMHMVVLPVLAGMIVVMDLFARSVRMRMLVLMFVLMLVFVGMSVRMLVAVVLMFVLMFVGMLMIMKVLVFMVSFHGFSP